MNAADEAKAQRLALQDAKDLAFLQSRNRRLHAMAKLMSVPADKSNAAKNGDDR